MIDRIGGIGLLAAALTLGAAVPAPAQTVELKLSHFVPPNHTFHKWAPPGASSSPRIRTAV